MKIQSITPVNYYQNNRLQKSKNDNSIAFQGKFLPKGIKTSDIFFAAALGMASAGLGLGYLVTKYVISNSDDNNNDE